MEFLKTYENTITESVFRKSKYLWHISDVQMFSIYINRSVMSSITDNKRLVSLIEKVKDMCDFAVAELGRLGFRSMHANIVLDNLNWFVANKDQHGIGDETPFGLAHTNRKFISLDINNVERANLRHAGEILMHEWAHLYLFNNSTRFKQGIVKLFAQIRSNNTTKIINHLLRHPENRNDVPMSANYKTNDVQSILDNLFTDISIDISNGKLDFNRIKEKLPKDISDFLYFSTPNSIELSPKQFANLKKITNAIIDDIQRNLFKLPPEYFTKGSMQYKQITGFSGSTILKKLVYLGKPRVIGITDLINAYYVADDISRKAVLNMPGYRELLQKVTHWPSPYGLSNSDEFWATAVESLFNIPYKYRQRIVELMTT